MTDDPRSRATRGYLESRVRGASPVELVSLLYDALSRELHCAADAVDRRDVAGKGLAIGRCLGVLGQLRVSLDHARGKEIATNLERLYVYWTVRLTQANVQSARAPIDEIQRHVETLRSAWGQATCAPALSAPAAPAGETAELRVAAAGGRSA